MDTISAPLKGKVALVTGGSRGIGAGIVQKFAEHGCTHIAITYASQKAKAEQVLQAVTKISPNIKTCAIASDLTDPDHGPKVIDQTLKGLSVDHIDILVCNAAIVDQASFGPVADMSKEQWDRVLTGNAWAPLSLSKAVINHMPSGGRIIMISSGSSKFPGGDPFVSYAASKAAMDAVSRNLAAMWGVKYGVTVNSISVGPTKTDATKEVIETNGPEFEEFLNQFPLLKRIAEVEEVASIVAFVASPAASWITGNQIPANGGGLSSAQS